MVSESNALKHLTTFVLCFVFSVFFVLFRKHGKNLKVTFSQVTSQIVFPIVNWRNYDETDSSWDTLMGMESNKYDDQEAIKLENIGIPRANHHRLIIGISNGHQGTTFLSRKESYLDTSNAILNDTLFVFENDNSIIQHPCMGTPNCHLAKKSKSIYHPLRTWYTSAHTQLDADYRRDSLSTVLYNNWEMRLAKKSAHPSQIFAMGHDSIYYFEGFAQYLKHTIFLRVRRPRVETARSFAECIKPGKIMRMFYPVNKLSCQLDICNEGNKLLPWFSYCPKDQPYNTVLKVGPQVWSKFSSFQRALWYIDELEARWMLFLREHPEAKVLNIKWSSKQPSKHGSMKSAHETVSSLLGFKSRDMESKAKAVGSGGSFFKKHANHTMNSDIIDLLDEQSRDYETKMNFTTDQRELIKKVQF